MCSSAASEECRALHELFPVDQIANIPHNINAAAHLHQHTSCKVEQHTWSVQLSAAPQFACPCFFHCFPPHLQQCPTHLSFLNRSTAHQDELPWRRTDERHNLVYICPHQPAFSLVQIILGTPASKTAAIQHEPQRAPARLSAQLCLPHGSPQLPHHHNIFKTFNEQKWFRSTCHQIAEASLLAHLTASQLPFWQLLADVLRVC